MEESEYQAGLDEMFGTTLFPVFLTGYCLVHHHTSYGSHQDYASSHLDSQLSFHLIFLFPRALLHIS